MQQSRAMFVYCEARQRSQLQIPVMGTLAYIKNMYLDKVQEKLAPQAVQAWVEQLRLQQTHHILTETPPCTFAAEGPTAATTGSRAPHRRPGGNRNTVAAAKKGGKKEGAAKVEAAEERILVLSDMQGGAGIQGGADMPSSAEQEKGRGGQADVDTEQNPPLQGEQQALVVAEQKPLVAAEQKPQVVVEQKAVVGADEVGQQLQAAFAHFVRHKATFQQWHE
eukprot:1085482-Pelagomonas_calceolata.AAC.3